jgi:hypothetical protein
MNPFLTLPIWASTLLILGFWIGIFLIVSKFINSFQTTEIRQSYKTLAATLGSPLFSAFLLLTAFLIASISRDFDRGRDAVQSELLAMERVTALLGTDAASNSIRKELKTYAGFVLTEEWPLLSKGLPGPATGNHLKLLIALVKQESSLEPDIRKTLRDEVRHVQEARVRRILVAEDNLPAVVWFALLVCSGVSGCFVQMVHAENLLAGRIMAVLYGLVVGTLFLVLILMDNPFAGTIAVKSDPIRNFYLSLP